MTVETPGAALEAADSDKVLLPLPGAEMLVGAKLAKTPLGAPLTEKVIAELNDVPFVVVKVIGMALPGATLTFVALGAKVNVGRTVRLIV